MTLGALSMAWVAAEAARPLGWVIVGVWLDQEKRGKWQAVANGPSGSAEVEIGHGGDPSQALRRLAEALQKRRGAPASG
ncbi:MAG: hypothetical protein H0W81_08700 [Chloroflexi bacterium]|nr:hypothetical protein [Chloroflexota bacterium]